MKSWISWVFKNTDSVVTPLLIVKFFPLRLLSKGSASYAGDNMSRLTVVYTSFSAKLRSLRDSGVHFELSRQQLTGMPLSLK